VQGAAHSVDEFDGPAMALWEVVKAEFVDIVEWPEPRR